LQIQGIESDFYGNPGGDFGMIFPWSQVKNRTIMEDLSKVAFAFSKLSEINNKRSDRYTAAADKIRNVYKKTVLMNYAFQAQQLSAELNRWLSTYKINTQPRPEHEHSTGISWEKIRSAFVPESETSIYARCESLEEEAMKGYTTALNLSFIPPKVLKEVKRHIEGIQKIRDNLRSMRNNNNMNQLKAA
jgi:uncharacterized protein (TIGR02284 family)